MLTTGAKVCGLTHATPLKAYALALAIIRTTTCVTKGTSVGRFARALALCTVTGSMATAAGPASAQGGPGFCFSVLGQEGDIGSNSGLTPKPVARQLGSVFASSGDCALDATLGITLVSCCCDCLEIVSSFPHVSCSLTSLLK